MKRRAFIKGVAATSTAVLLPMSVATQQPDVIILGAGLSGLSAALQLKKAGLSVKILEADSRIGGRVKTLNHVVTKPEAGGMQIGQGYGYMRLLAQQLGVALEPLSGFVRGNAFIIDGKLLSADAWPAHRSNHLSASERDILPSRLYFHYLKKMPKLPAASDWNTAAMAHLDVSMLSLLEKAGASSQAIQLMNANVNANNLAQLSAADALHGYTKMLQGGRGADKVVGGNSQFINAMSAELSQHIETNKVVSRISATNKSVTIACADGSQYQAKQCICTIPYSVLRNISVSADIPNVQRQAINTLNYTAITQVHFEVTDDSWLADGLPGAMWSNHAIGRVFASKNSQGKISHLLCWINGDAAKKLDTLPTAEAINFVHQQLVKTRPSLLGKIKPVHIESWGNNPFSRGAYASFSPGQVQAFSHQLAQSCGYLHFAGEHTNFEYSGMESALVSGLKAAEVVVNLA